MDASHAVLIAVQEEGAGRLVGRTLLQKKLYFACLLLGEDFAFRPHYYGPYSQQVADATDSLVSNRFLEEQVEVFPEHNLFGERRRHSYELTEDGTYLLQSIEAEADAAQWHEAFQKISRHPLAADFNLLSIAAKVITIRVDIGEATAEEIGRKAIEYGWNLTPQQIAQVADFLEHLGLPSKAE